MKASVLRLQALTDPNVGKKNPLVLSFRGQKIGKRGPRRWRRCTYLSGQHLDGGPASLHSQLSWLYVKLKMEAIKQPGPDSARGADVSTYPYTVC